VKRQGEAMGDEIIKVAVSPDPRMANRLKLANLFIEFGQLQVLLIDPPPTDDPTGFTGPLGITGELKPPFVRALPSQQKPTRVVSRSRRKAKDLGRCLDSAYSQIPPSLGLDLCLWGSASRVQRSTPSG
jgi:hypothetical protein